MKDQKENQEIKELKVNQDKRQLDPKVMKESKEYKDQTEDQETLDHTGQKEKEVISFYNTVPYMLKLININSVKGKFHFINPFNILMNNNIILP